jgi:hypothetical protein
MKDSGYVDRAGRQLNLGVIPMSFQDETKARRIPDVWRGASEALMRSRSATSEQRRQRSKKQAN